MYKTHDSVGIMLKQRQKANKKWIKINEEETTFLDLFFKHVKLKLKTKNDWSYVTNDE